MDNQLSISPGILEDAAAAWYEHLLATYSPPAQVWQMNSKIATEADYMVNLSIGMFDPEFHREGMANMRAMNGGFTPLAYGPEVA